MLTEYSDMLNPNKKYNLEYYLGVVDKIVAMGAHVVGIKDSKLFTRLRCFWTFADKISQQWLVS